MLDIPFPAEPLPSAVLSLWVIAAIVGAAFIGAALWTWLSIRASRRRRR
jgi:hypothetical protein